MYVFNLNSSYIELTYTYFLLSGTRSYVLFKTTGMYLYSKLEVLGIQEEYLHVYHHIENTYKYVELLNKFRCPFIFYYDISFYDISVSCNQRQYKHS